MVIHFDAVLTLVTWGKGEGQPHLPSY
jgi:hypothetical protein